MPKTDPEERTLINCHLEAGEWQLAASRLQERLEDPGLLLADRLWMIDNLGYAYFRLGRPSDALACCRQAIDLDPGHAYAYKGQGVCLAGLGQLDAGVTSLLKAISLEPNFFDAYHDLAVVLMQAGHHDQAKPWAQRAYQLDPVRGEALARKFK